MGIALRIVVGALLVAHGLVHLMWFASAKDASWPFHLDRSWLLPEHARRPAGIALIAVVVAAFALLGLAVWGVPLLASTWVGLAVVGGAASLAVLVAYWDRQLVWGVAIDVVVLVVALWRPGWTDSLD